MARLIISHSLCRLIKISLLISILTACGQSSSFVREGSSKVTEEESQKSDLIYQILLAEFAGVRGEMVKSAEYYSTAARQTDDVGVLERSAYIALYAKQLDKALEITDHWLKVSGKNDEISRIRALVFLRQAKVTSAASEIEQLLIVDGTIERSDLAALGHILKKEVDGKVALGVLALLNQRHKDEAGLLMLQARFEVNAFHHEKAILLIERVIKIAPDISDAYLIKAQILAAQGDQMSSVKSVAMAVDKRPLDHKLRLQYARMLVQMKLFDEAWQHFMQLKDAMPEDENILLSLGLLSIETGKTELAKKYLQSLIDKGYHNLQAHYYLGRIQQSQNEYMPAIANFGRVTEGQYMLDARIRSAGLLAETGQVDAALDKLKMLNEGRDNGSEIKVYLAQGALLRNADRDVEALSIYNTALKSAPENTDLLYARALTAEKLDMLELTESDLRMVLIHEPENATVLNALGYTLADRTQRLDEAKGYILKAVKLLPDDPSILDSLGWVYYRLGEYGESIKWLRKAFAQYEDAEIAAHLGEALWMDGQQIDAGKIWQRGLEMKADNPVLLDTIDRYKK